MKDRIPEFLQGRSHTFIRYVKRFNEVTRELRWLKIGLAVTLAGCLAAGVLLGKMSVEHVAKPGPAERMALIFAIVYFLFYKWREQRYTKALSDIEAELQPEERIAVRSAVSVG